MRSGSIVSCGEWQPTPTVSLGSNWHPNNRCVRTKCDVFRQWNGRNVAPRRTSRAGDFLDTELPAFTAKNVTVLEVLAQYRRVFDLTAPTSVAGALTSTLSAPNEDTTERQRIVAESLTRRFSVDRSNVTARDVLNAICQAHGSLSWKVQHIDGMADFSHSRVAFVTADGSRVHD